MFNHLAIALALMIPPSAGNDHADQPDFSKSIDEFTVHVESVAITRMRAIDAEPLTKFGLDVDRFRRAIVLTIAYPQDVNKIGPISIVDAKGVEHNLTMGGTPLLNGTIRPQISDGFYCHEAWFPLAQDDNLLELLPITLRIELTPDDGKTRLFEIEKITP